MLAQTLGSFKVCQTSEIMKIRVCSFSFCSFVVVFFFFLELISTEYFPGCAGRQSSVEHQLQHRLRYESIAWFASHFINGFIEQCGTLITFSFVDILEIQKMQCVVIVEFQHFRSCRFLLAALEGGSWGLMCESRDFALSLLLSSCHLVAKWGRLQHVKSEDFCFQRKPLFCLH